MIKIHKSKDGQFYFTINGRNGQVIVTSETYKTKQSVRRGIKALEKIMNNPVLRTVNIKDYEKYNSSREL